MTVNIIYHINSQTRDNLAINYSVTYNDDTARVKVTLINQSNSILYFLCDESYRGDYFSEVDSVMYIDFDYLNKGYDWLIMPWLEFEFKKLKPKESWKIVQVKKSKKIEKVVLAYNLLEQTRRMPKKIKRRLQQGYLTVKEFFTDYVQDNLETDALQLDKI